MAALTLTIKIDPSLLMRFLSEVPADEQDKFATCALQAALDERASSCAKSEDHVQRTIMSPRISPPRPKAGRPAPAIPKTKMSLYLDDQVWAALKDSRRANQDVSLSAATNRVLRKALSLDD